MVKVLYWHVWSGWLQHMYLGMEGVLSTLVGFCLQLIRLLTLAIPILDDNRKMHDHY